MKWYQRVPKPSNRLHKMITKKQDENQNLSSYRPWWWWEQAKTQLKEYKGLS